MFQPSFSSFRFFLGTLKSQWLLALCLLGQMREVDPFITQTQQPLVPQGLPIGTNSFDLNHLMSSTLGLLFSSSESEGNWHDSPLTQEPKSQGHFLDLSFPLGHMVCMCLFPPKLLCSVLPVTPLSTLLSPHWFLVLQPPHWGRQNSKISPKISSSPLLPLQVSKSSRVPWAVDMMVFTPMIRP